MTIMKRIIFYISLLFIPVLFIVIFEMLLVLFNFGDDYQLFVEDGAYFRLNENYARKYFSSQDIAIPQLIDQTFLKEKDPNTIRIVCLGGSTTAGYPFEININFPYFMRRYLEDHLPGYTYEVINLGISAVNSHTVLDMCPDVAKMNPDFIIIYMGHNEFYGALGLASNEFLGSNRWLIKTILRLREYRSYQLWQRAVEQLFALIGSQGTTEPDQTLMAAMIGSDQIEPDGPVFGMTMKNFKANLNEILQFWRKQGVPVIISDLVSNLKDQFPLGTPVATLNDHLALEQLDQATTYYNRGDWDTCMKLYSELLAGDSTNPLFHYYLADSYYQMESYDRAYEHFVLARDFDRMPFRAPSAVNRIISRIAVEPLAHYVSVESHFRSLSPGGITDRSLFLEHVHPNARGYEELARVFLQKCLSLINSRAVPIAEIHIPVDYTDLDVAIGEMKALNLLQQKPFDGKTGFIPTSISDPKIKEIAQAHVFNGLFWDGAHLQLGQHFQSQGKLDQAAREYLAILKFDGRHITALVRMGDMRFLDRQWAEAEHYYRQALSLSNTRDYIKAKLGKMYIASEQDEQGIGVLSELLLRDRLESAQVIENRAELFYLLAIGLARQGQYEQARETVNSALAIDSQYVPAIELMNQLKALKKSAGL